MRFLITKALSIKLQGPYVDMVRAYNDISQVKKQVTENRNKVEQFHQCVYNVAVTLAAKVGVLECKPRTFQGRQSHRANPDNNSPSDFYRLTITIPILDHLKSQLEDRFDDSSISSRLLMEFIKLLPSEIFKNKSQVGRHDIATLIDCYTDDLPSEYTIDVELQAWLLKWKDNVESPKHNTAPKALAKADKIIFPNLYTLLHVAVTSPVTSVVCERSISSLHFIKSSLRATMTNSRMNALAIMFIHHQLAAKLVPEVVVNKFAARNSRKMHLNDLCYS